MNNEGLWNNFLEIIQEDLSTFSFDTWFKDTKLHSLKNNVATVIVPVLLTKKHLEDNYLDMMIEVMNKLTGNTVSFNFILEDEIVPEDLDIGNYIVTESSGNDHNYADTNLNSDYTFETFVVGNSNRFAYTASRAVAESPGKTYNPLFLYGESGVGKTHLMHAIGNRILENNRNCNVLYVTSEKFTNQLINAIKDNKNEIFRNKYRTIDVLLIDDIQFIAGKERIQEEFFHTFNSLYEERKQIIISSDKPPRDIPFLEDRLKSRFEWGLLADISCPDYETRFAILRKKAQDENVIIDDYILSNIANKIDSNIRELEGVFNKVVARASLTHSPITIELAEKIINEFKYESEKVISCDFIKETVAKYFSINKEDLSSNKRSNDIAFPRQIAMYLCREIANMSYPQIGVDFGGRDHSTVMHGCKKIEKEVKEKNNTKLIVDSVKNIIINGKQ